MSSAQANNRRIVKNTLLLYVRMLLLMCISLYTSRVILEALGVEDYGIYNVVGGVVAMFSTLSASLSNAVSRFITYELGTGDARRLHTVFCTSVTIQFALSLIVLIVAEVVGVWFLNTKLNIPIERMEAANWALQCSIFAFIVNLVSVPYNAAIIAHERMSVFAYISIFEAVCKLAVAVLVVHSPFDKLVFYAVLLAAISLIMRLIYGVYCQRQFAEATYRPIWDGSVFRQMFSFAGWSFFGNAVFLLNSQGVNMLINIFFSVTMNAARGITMQVNNVVMQFVNNFMTALKPQITKSYASGDRDYMFQLINRGTKFSVFIMLFFFVPLALEADTVLSLWLKDVPEHSVVFMRMVLLSTFVEAAGNTLYQGLMSVGRIRVYQIIVCFVGVLSFVITWIAYRMGASAVSCYVVTGAMYTILAIVRLQLLRQYVGFSGLTFLKKVVFPITWISAVSLVVPLPLTGIMPQSVWRLILVTATAVVFTSIVIYLGGLTDSERTFVVGNLTKAKQRLCNKK